MVEATVAYYMGGPGTPVLIFLLLSIFCSSPASMQILYQDFKVTGVFSLVAVEKKKCTNMTDNGSMKEFCFLVLKGLNGARRQFQV